MSITSLKKTDLIILIASIIVIAFMAGRATKINQKNLNDHDIKELILVEKHLSSQKVDSFLKNKLIKFYAQALREKK